MAKLTPGVRALFEGANFGHLATIMPDGSPQVTVVWVDVEGDNILVNTAEGRIKPRNVCRDPRVAISIYNQDVPYQSATVQGEVVEVRSEGALESIHRLAKKYMGLDEYPNLRPGDQRLLFVIRPDQVAGMRTDD
ncbi:MAG TPA: PPOX class F420-dependent oxidoreductase [Dehalococcoidia bacterium]